MKRIITVLLVLCLALGFAAIALSAAAEDGGSDAGGDISIPADTPVTYGYLQSFREQLKREIIEELMRSGGIELGDGYEDLSLDRGGILVLGANCELIYRGGGAAALTSSEREGDGLGDMSDGRELFSGEALNYGHVYFASDSEAEKAILITGGTAYFTVRGSYEIR